MALTTGTEPLAQGDPTFWMPPQGSTGAFAVDWAFYLTYYVSVFFFLVILVLTVTFVVRYRWRRGARPESGPSSHLAVELTWTLIPTVVVVVIFAVGLGGFMDISFAPSNAYEIQVVGQKWKWFFQYPNGYVDADLHVPEGQPVRLVLSSQDVIHSLYIPAFRVKMDAVPGRYTKMWFHATRPGEYDLYCAEYCGTGHSDMVARAVVHPAGQFEKWLESAGNWVQAVPPAEAGRILTVGRPDGSGGRGCTQCHRVDGQAHVGPPLNGLFGHEVTLADGTRVVADENYLRESLIDPQAKIVAGYQAVMPTYKGRLKEREITAIIEYLKSIAGGRAPAQGAK